MVISDYSRFRVYQTLKDWHIDADFADPMYNYLVLGHDPGSFFTALLANDALGAFQKSHPANDMRVLKYLAGWIRDRMPVRAYGSYEAVRCWLALTPADRRTVLEQLNLIYTPQQETWMRVQGHTVQDPMLRW